MPSTFFGLNIGYTGLISASASLNTTGHNIANVETEGYSRQQTVQQAAKAIRTNQTYGMAGAGVDTISIDQMRNAYYDLKFWDNNANLGMYSIKQQYSTEIELYFTDKDNVQGFNVIFSDMFDSLDEVYKSSGDDTVKSEYLSRCQTLTEYFNSMYSNLQELQADANDEIQNKVNEINAIASEIATLNKQINTIEVSGTKANELRDKRSLLVDRLSLIVDVEVQEIPIYTTEGKQSDGSDPEESGIYRYIVNVGGGQNLVNSYDYSTILCKARDYKANQSDADGLYDLYWSSDGINSNGIEFNLYGGNLGGELKGLIEVRDGNNDEYFHGMVDSVGALSATDGQDITITVNEKLDYLTDINKLTLPEDSQIQLGNKLFSYDSWELTTTYDAGTDTYSHVYTFHLNAGQDDASIFLNKEAGVGTTVDYQGIPYYMSQLNEWCRVFAEANNKIELQAQDNYGNHANELFLASAITGVNSTYDNTDPQDDEFNYDFSAYDYSLTSKQQSLKSTDDNYHRLTAATFKVNEAMQKDVNLFGTTKDISQGQDAQDITQELLTIKVDKAKASFRGCTSGEFLQCITTDTALNAASANSFQANYDKISRAIINQRLSEMGVDNDEEALNLVKFQEAFNLASKMIQVMTEIYDQLILRTGV